MSYAVCRGWTHHCVLWRVHGCTCLDVLQLNPPEHCGHLLPVLRPGQRQTSCHQGGGARSLLQGEIGIFKLQLGL